MRYKKDNDLINNQTNFDIEELKVANYSGMHIHYHEHFEIYYLLSDNIKYLICDKNYRLKKGALVLIKPFDFHKTIPDVSKKYNRIMINFDSNYLTNDERLLLCCFLNSTAISLDKNQQLVVENIFRRMVKERAGKEQYHNLLLKALLLELLVYVNRNIISINEKESNIIKSDTHKKFNNILCYINDNYQNYISLSEISGKFSLTPYYICKLFKNNLGITFVDYLNNTRIKEAQKLLKKTNLHITDVAITVGFDSSSHFGKIFKKVTNLTPTQYRIKVDDNI